MVIGDEPRARLIDHARAEAPNECCGLIALDGDRIVSIHPLENLAASPMRFEVDGARLAPLLMEIEDAGDLPLPHALGALSVADRHQLRPLLARHRVADHRSRRQRA